MARLIVRYPDNRIQEVEFDKPVFRIGSSEDNDLIVSHEEVEAHHAEITNEAGAFFIKNLSERENTTVNGKKIDRINLNYGDRIALGPVICLFYPETRKKVGARPKLYMIIGGGGLIIIVSIIMVFYFTTRQISTVVGEKMALTEIVGEAPSLEEITGITSAGKEQPPVVKKVAPKLKEMKPEKEIRPEAAGKLLEARRGVTPQPEIISEKKGLVARLSTLFQRRMVELPEPTPEEIQKRKAVAVPRGLRRLFFRKIPIVVSPELTFEQVQKPGFKGTGGMKGEAPPAQEGQPSEGKMEAFPGEETLPATSAEEVSVSRETGFFTRFFVNPMKRLLGGGKGEEVIQPGIGISGEEVPPVGTGTTPLGAGETPPQTTEEVRPSVEKPGKEELLKLADPIAYLKSIELSIFKQESFIEKPVYSEEEILEYTRERLIGGVELSEGENINTGIVWEYPGGVLPEETGEKIHISNTGTIGEMNGDKTPDFMFGSREGILISLNGIDGTEIIRKDFNYEFFEPVCLSEKKLTSLIISGVGGRIEAYDRNLNQLWVFEEKNGLASQPLAVDLNGDGFDDLVYPTISMEVFAIDGRTGLELWRFFDLGSEPLWAPVGSDINGDGVRDVLILTRGGRLHAIDGKSGWGLWVAEIYGLPVGPPLIMDIDGDRKDEILCLTRRGIITVFNVKGEPLFTYELKRKFRVTPSGGDFDGDKVPEIALVDVNGVVTSFEPITRRIDWELETEDTNIIGRIAVGDTNYDGITDILFNSLSGLLYVLDGSSGSILAQHNLEDYILSSPLVYDINGDKMPEIIESTYSGKVMAIRVGESKPGFFSRIITGKPGFWASVNGNPLNTGYNRYSKISLFGK